jgi:foldase protein PrsA
MLSWKPARRRDPTFSPPPGFDVTHPTHWMDMKTFRLLSLPLLLVSALLVAGCGGGGGTKSVPQNAVAIVGADTITKQQYNDLLAAARSQYKAQKKTFPKVGTTAYKSLSDSAVTYLVQESELEQRAPALGVTIGTKDVDSRIAQIKKQYFAGSDKKYKAQLKAQGLTEAQLRQDLHAQILAERLYNKVTAKVEVSDAAVKSYYEQNKSQYTTKASRDVRHILVGSKKKADDLEAQLKKGASFATLAKKYSTDTTSAKKGGDLGQISQGQTVASFDKVAFALKTNEISQPVHSTYGWHIIQALGPVKPAKVTPLKSVSASIRTNLLSTKKTTVMQKWVDQLKKDFASRIVYQTGYTPAATTSASTTTPATTTG